MDEAFEKVKDAVLTYEKNVHITDTETSYNTNISTWEYRRAKKGSVTLYFLLLGWG